MPLALLAQLLKSGRDGHLICSMVCKVGGLCVVSFFGISGGGATQDEMDDNGMPDDGQVTEQIDSIKCSFVS
jgi:hypothetical protein